VNTNPQWVVTPREKKLRITEKEAAVQTPPFSDKTSKKNCFDIVFSVNHIIIISLKN